MQNIRKTKKQLIEELSTLQKQTDELKKAMILFVPEEDVFEVIGNNMQTGIYIIQNDKTIFTNSYISSYSGYSQEELLNLSLMQNTVHPEDQERIRKSGIRMLKGEVLTPYEYRIFCKDGSIKWLMEKVASISYRGKRAVLGNTMDITDKKRTEDELRDIKAKLEILVQERTSELFTKNKVLKESEEKFRALMETTSAGIYLIQDNKFVYVNPAFEDITRYSLNELGDLPFWNFIHPDFRKLVKEKGSKRLKGEEPPERYEFQIIIKDGQEKWIELSATSFIDWNNKPTIMGSMFDITERKQAEESLKRSEYLYRAIFENTGDAIILLREDTKIILVNSEFEKLSGYSKQEIEGKKSWTEFIIEEDLTRMLQYHHLRRIDKNAAPRKYECRFIDRYGNIKDIAISVDMNPDTKENIASLHDITERNQAEKILQDSQRRLADIIDFFPDATLIIDKDGKIIAWNRALEAMTGVKKEAMLGKGNHEYALPFYGNRRPILIDLALYPNREMEKKYTSIQRVGDILLGESFTTNLPSGNIHLSGTASVLRDETGEIVAAIECIRDNTERKVLEEHLNRAEKMESLGTLAGGVAHDLNNVLGILVGYSELIREELPENSSLIRYADNLMQSSMRASAIIQDLLTLARRGVNVSEVVDLNGFVFNYLRTPEFEKLKSYHPDVKIWTELEDSLLNIKGSPIHLGKTIMNLVSNAAEAISGHGEVTIRTENRYLDHPIHGYDAIQEGDYAVLMVSDNGSGISANDLGKIFEPFYTKKVMGRSGTGLGLAVVWGTVKDHHGYIDVQSEESKGTTFTLYFPATREAPAKVEKTASPVAYRSRGESVLVVDDVKEQRELAMNILGRFGYQVDAVASGEAAVEYIKNKKVDLIVLDMIMDPGIDGLEAYRRILEVNPGQKAIIVSGFSETGRVRKAQEMGAGRFVRKPYILEKIGLAVRNELDRK